MNYRSAISSDGHNQTFAQKRGLLLRMVRGTRSATRSEIGKSLGIDKSSITEIVKPLIKAGILREGMADHPSNGRPSRALSFADGQDRFLGLNLGVRRSQVGVMTLNGDITEEVDFETPSDAAAALRMAREEILHLYEKHRGRRFRALGVSVPGTTDPARRELTYAPNLGWKKVKIAEGLQIDPAIPVVVENDSTAAAMYEARVRIRQSAEGLLPNFVLLRSGTGIGAGLVIDGEVFRGSAEMGMAGELGHMTIVAGGKPCVCGNRGCWEKYASAASAASLYLGDRPPARGESVPRFVEIVSKAENGDVRSRRTLEKIGDYLGIGVANVIMTVGIPRIIISGRLVYGWKFIKDPMNDAIGRSIIGKTKGWSVEAGEPIGSALGGALEVAAEEFLSTL
ncbi:MAG: ROK family transcriptional regulator [Acidobacteria bacterium]|nr:ROK family transcriptional regulator [Acidobacteriota bacterium]